jgi:histidine triad (HIT) family protein
VAQEESVFSKKPMSSWLLESDNAFVIEDKYPQAPVHLLVISKEMIKNINEAPPHLIAEMLELAKTAAKKFNIDQSGYRIVINTNKAGGQTVYHLHIHVLGGRNMQWPPG